MAHSKCMAFSGGNEVNSDSMQICYMLAPTAIKPSAFSIISVLCVCVLDRESERE